MFTTHIYHVSTLHYDNKCRYVAHFIGFSRRGPYSLYELSTCLFGGSWRGPGGGLEVREAVWGLGVIKMHFLSGIFQIQLLGEEMCGKNCIFQDNIGHEYSKCFS